MFTNSQRSANKVTNRNLQYTSVLRFPTPDEQPKKQEISMKRSHCGEINLLWQNSLLLLATPTLLGLPTQLLEAGGPDWQRDKSCPGIWLRDEALADTEWTNQNSPGFFRVIASFCGFVIVNLSPYFLQISIRHTWHALNCPL